MLTHWSVLFSGCGTLSPCWWEPANHFAQRFNTTHLKKITWAGIVAKWIVIICNPNTHLLLHFRRSCPANMSGTAAGDRSCVQAPATPLETRMKLPASAWPSTGCCNHLQSEPTARRSLSPLPSLSVSLNFKQNKGEERSLYFKNK